MRAGRLEGIDRYISTLEAAHRSALVRRVTRLAIQRRDDARHFPDCVRQTRPDSSTCGRPSLTVTYMHPLLKLSALIGSFTLVVGCSPTAEDVDTANAELVTSGVTTTKACFTAHNLGTTVSITGTIFEAGARTADKPVMLLLHGMAADRSFFDGGPNAPPGTPSFARNLAAKGYVTITIDRPGYGESPYRPRIPIGGGFQLTPGAQIDMVHEVVEQIHAGSYTTTTGSCPSGERAATGSQKVVLSGFSLSGGLVEGYAAKFDDVAAIAPMSWANQGMSKFLLGIFLRNQALTQLRGNDYVPYYRPSDDGVSDECVTSTFFEPMADPETVRRVCANEKLQLSPAGELDFSLLLQPKIKNAVRDKKFAKLPVFLVFGDHDRDFPGSFAVAGEKNQQADELALWKDCGCDLTPFIQKDTGHVPVLQPNMPELADAIDGWLKARGLGGH